MDRRIKGAQGLTRAHVKELVQIVWAHSGRFEGHPDRNYYRIKCWSPSWQAFMYSPSMRRKQAIDLRNNLRDEFYRLGPGEPKFATGSF